MENTNLNCKHLKSIRWKLSVVDVGGVEIPLPPRRGPEAMNGREFFILIHVVHVLKCCTCGMYMIARFSYNIMGLMMLYALCIGRTVDSHVIMYRSELHA